MPPHRALSMVNPNPGRNDRCWCGSGRKYKRCHVGRDQLQPLPLHQIDSQLRQIYSMEYCLHADAPAQCGPRFINAHTVQNHGQLNQISEQGHVIGVDRSSYLNYANGRPRLCASASIKRPRTDASVTTMIAKRLHP